MIKNTPAMGWNSWNTFAENINEELIINSADVLVNTGLKDAGYEYIVIDDCWCLHERDEKGRLVPDPKKFPHGMKYVADYVHSKGLKFGMYSCAGVVTCAGYPASYEHEFIDAATFAEWGVDFLKYDYCFHSTGTPGHLLYKRMGIACQLRQGHTVFRLFMGRRRYARVDKGNGRQQLAFDGRYFRLLGVGKGHNTISAQIHGIQRHGLL